MNLPPELIPFLEREAGEALREAQLGAQCKVELIQHARNCMEIAGWARVSQPSKPFGDFSRVASRSMIGSSRLDYEL